jgi:hypothetical protein
MRVEINVQKLEQNMTAYIATTLGKTVDVDVFRGGIPDGVDTGIGVIVAMEINEVTSLSASAYELQPVARLFAVQIIGKFNSRDDAWSLLSSMRGLVPVYNHALDDFTIVCLAARGDSNVEATNDKGKVKHVANINLVLNAIPKTAEAGSNDNPIIKEPQP